MRFPSGLRRHALAACLAFGLSACNLGPAYHRPEVAAPAAWSEISGGPAAPAAWPSAEWWQGFASPQLNDLIARARNANDDLAAAVARVREADAQARIAGAPLLPTVDAGFSASRQRAQTTGSGHSTTTQFSPLVSASYELDFWGKNRAALDAAVAAADASRYDRVTVELTVMSSVATTYFQLLELHDRARIAQDNYDTAQRLLDGLRAQQHAGVANALDVAQQATVTATLYAAIPPLQQQLQQTRDALAILAGVAPGTVDVEVKEGEGALAALAQPQVAPGLPSELLARRPDVAEAEAQLIAANADIREARAAYFPSISLTADGGYASESLSNLFNPANAVFQLAASAAQPIFHGGALQGQSEYTRARYAELLADYHKTALTAFGNVQDALAAVQQTAEQQRRQQQAADTARRAYEFSQAQLHAGTINVLTLLNTESALFSAQDALAQVRYAHLQALVQLFNALGGGWQRDQGDIAS